ncbi:alpha-L-fucosidase [Maribellus comscasis]|uniref:alpha-L-fucosidase n=1 Tax=Maribellus comscasis TaxID=2681766 RepID=A0A6I6K0J6_9BACT|nr:alpha-L-fucosidase [Maribellus comscasis]QGY46960.1 alpha-L-fucosidase [Maribellus comscasis]
MWKKLMFFVLTLCVLSAKSQYVDTAQVIYFNDLNQLKQHKSPQWFNDAKLGIFIHWGLYSVPAFAPTKGSIRDIMDKDRRAWFMNNSYAEWYLNTLRIKGSPTYEYHKKNYGLDFDYYKFSETFNKELAGWKPEEMAEIFKNTGARYVVLTSKHHDGYPLWPSRVHNNNMTEAAQPVSRDIVGELTKAVRDKGMKMGLYYSGGLDWTFNRTPVLGIRGLKISTPHSLEYANVADAHLRELIEKYQPSVLWGDIYYPDQGNISGIVADYYNLIPEGVINNRWGASGLSDFSTPEYNKFESIQEDKWESCRGLGYSFGYNQFEDDSHTLSSTELIHLLIDVVSKNGNLLINVGPKPDGTIPAIQLDRLKELGEWMKVNGEGVYDTKPWQVCSGETVSGKEYRFTQKGDKLYLIMFEKPEKEEVFKNLVLKTGTELSLLGNHFTPKWKQNETNLKIDFPGDISGKHAYVIEFSALPGCVIE